jgi:hypothetical protein
MSQSNHDISGLHDILKRRRFSKKCWAIETTTLNYWAEVEFKFVCSNSTTSLSSQVLLMLMNYKPILSNSFIKC